MSRTLKLKSVLISVNKKDCGWNWRNKNALLIRTINKWEKSGKEINNCYYIRLNVYTFIWTMWKQNDKCICFKVFWD